MKISKQVTLTLLAFALPFIVGCFTQGGHNPVADTSLSQTSQNLTATAENVDPQVLACKYSGPTLKKYTFSETPHAVGHHLRAGYAKAKGCFRVKIDSVSSTDHIYITLAEMKVKKQNGKMLSVDLSNQEIDLLQAANVSSVLSDAELEPGVYQNMTFKISSARLVLNGESHNLVIPSDRVHFIGKFEIKEGYRTELAIKFIHKYIRAKLWRGYAYFFVPVVKISYKLVEIVVAPPAVTDGDVTGLITDNISKSPISGLVATLEGTSFSATSDASGKFTFSKVPQGDYLMKLAHPDYLDKSFTVSVTAGQVADVTAEMNPAVVKSTIANTGWFSLEYPFADASGKYAEVSMETPVVIDFNSLNFAKVQVTFDAEYYEPSQGLFRSYISSTKQLTPLQDLGSWWVGNTATLGTLLGDFNSTQPASHYSVDVTEYVRNNPNGFYFLATRNLAVANMKLTNIQMTIFYR